MSLIYCCQQKLIHPTMARIILDTIVFINLR